MSQEQVATPQDELICRRCHQPVIVNKALYYDVFEHMHELCFHLEYEHYADPDEPCDHPYCPQFRLQVFQRKLIELGFDPQQVIDDANLERYSRKYNEPPLK